MPRDGRVGAAVTGHCERFDRLVEFVNCAVAVALMIAAWVLVVELLALWDRHDRHEHHVR
jgi:hypothetical protein